MSVAKRGNQNIDWTYTKDLTKKKRHAISHVIIAIESKPMQFYSNFFLKIYIFFKIISLPVNPDSQQKSCKNHIYSVFMKPIKKQKPKFVNIALKLLLHGKRYLHMFVVCIWKIQFDGNEHNVKFVMHGLVIDIH